MRLSDISLAKRLLMGNFLMVAIPVCMILGFGWIILSGVQFLDSGQKSAALSMIWPDKAPMLSVQYGANSLLQRVERKKHLKSKDLAKDCQILEAQGIQVMVRERGAIFYLSEGADAEYLEEESLARCQGISPSLLWDNRGFALCYISPVGDRCIFAIGNLPLTAYTQAENETLIEMLEILLLVLVGLAVIVIIMLGRYLSRSLSRQVLEPLSQLRQAAREIQDGRLDKPLSIEAGDELGETCREFDRMRRELLLAQENRQRYENNRRELLAGISHDLATPLTSLHGRASGLLDGIVTTKEKERQYLEQMLHTVTHMEKLVDSLFLFSKLEIGKIEFHYDLVCIRDYLADWIEERADMVKERGLVLTWKADGGEALVQLDRNQFPRVLDNIVENSIKYKKGSTGRLQISMVENDKDISLFFADNGQGVAQEDLSKLFDSFYRTDPARSNVSKGSGLGLAITRQIVLAMKGEIWAESTPEGGLTIVIRLPRCQKKEDVENVKEENTFSGR